MNNLFNFVSVISLVATLCNGQLTPDQKRQLLRYHNDMRRATAEGKTPGQPSAVEIKPMVWDETSSNIAQRHADKCIDDHSDRKSRLYGGFARVGENIAYDSNNDATLISLAKGWYDEYKYYDYNRMDCIKHQVCLHYTQMVWSNSTRLGCGMKRNCNHPNYKSFLVCQYAMGGNWGDLKPYEKGTGNDENKSKDDDKTCNKDKESKPNPPPGESGGPGGPPTTGTMDKGQDDLYKRHKDFRSKGRYSQILWSSSLAAKALIKAKTCSEEYDSNSQIIYYLPKKTDDPATAFDYWLSSDWAKKLIATKSSVGCATYRECGGDRPLRIVCNYE